MRGQPFLSSSCFVRPCERVRALPCASGYDINRDKDYYVVRILTPEQLADSNTAA